MKYILIALLLAATSVMAEEPPAFLKDASIVVTLKNGKQYLFSANQWKVVPRLDKETLVCTRDELKCTRDTLDITETAMGNRVRFVGGFGPQGVDISKSATEITVSNKTEPVFGLGYDRKVSKRFSLGGQFISNGTYTLGLGLDF